jgi:polysaccharide biosynthesis/export protein
MLRRFPMCRPLFWSCLFCLTALTRLIAAEPAVEATPVAAQGDYLLQPGDLLRVQVFQEADLLREVRISQEFVITLPLIENVNVRNKTVRQAEQMIRELYDKDFLVNPQVNLIVLEYSRRTVNVLGSVNNPGAVPFPPEQKLTLLDAITRAGGFNRLADRKRVKLTRANGENVIVNVDQLIGGSAAEKWTLQINDTIYVPERVL